MYTTHVCRNVSTTTVDVFVRKTYVHYNVRSIISTYEGNC